MAEPIQLLDSAKIKPNPENPRLVFHPEELAALQDSIATQGILVPLTVYPDEGVHVILDGERRWRSAVKLGMKSVPAIVQPKPDKMTNLMMMFAIHHRRNEWDPLPTALKLKALEELYTKRYGKRPTETQLAEVASLTRGEVRRHKKILAIPGYYRELLLKEIYKPRSEQTLTVDHVLEATNGASALRKREIIDSQEEEQLRRAIVAKFQGGVIRNTVSPRKLARIARAVQREELELERARKAVVRLILDPKYGIDEAFADTAESFDFQHSLEQLVDRLSGQVAEHAGRGYRVPNDLKKALLALRSEIDRLLEA